METYKQLLKKVDDEIDELKRKRGLLIEELKILILKTEELYQKNCFMSNVLHQCSEQIKKDIELLEEQQIKISGRSSNTTIYMAEKYYPEPRSVLFEINDRLSSLNILKEYMEKDPPRAERLFSDLFY